MDHVSKGAATVRTLRRLELCKLAIIGHEIGCLDKGFAIFKMNMIVHAYHPIQVSGWERFRRGSLSNWRIAVVNAAFTRFFRWRARAANAMALAMNRDAQGTGAIIAAAIIAGVIGGVVARQPSIGFLAGTGAGILIALLLYFRGRRA